MSNDANIQAICETIRTDYSPCDVSDALLKLGVPSAGYLKDIGPIPSRQNHATRTVAPISTVLFVPKTHTPGATTVPSLPSEIPASSNLSKETHWTDAALPGSAVLMQQPSDQIVALVGDIVATRYKSRGIAGVFVDGRTRDVVGCGKLCGERFTVWGKGLSSVGTSLEAKPWAVDVPIRVGGTLVKAGDLLVADEAEGVACVVPRERVEELIELLSVLKKADDGVLRDVQGGMDFKSALKRWPKHYTNH